MNPPVVLKKLSREYHTQAQARRQVIARSNEALSLSKRAIFALHRNDPKAARTMLEQAAALFLASERFAKNDTRLLQEGAHRAALEEYAEALLFERYLDKGSIGSIDNRAMQADCYFAGLSDATGEIVRHALRHITLGHTQVLKPARETVEMIIEFFLSLDLTGYLRTKFDQAKKNLSRLEDLEYDLSIRR